MFYILLLQDISTKDTVKDSSSILFSLTYLPATNRLGIFVLKAKDLQTTQDSRGEKRFSYSYKDYVMQGNYTSPALQSN